MGKMYDWVLIHFSTFPLVLIIDNTKLYIIKTNIIPNTSIFLGDIICIRDKKYTHTHTDTK